MDLTELYNEIAERMNESIKSYYDNIKKVLDDDMTEDERQIYARLSNIAYGETSAYNNCLEIIRKFEQEVLA